MFQAEPFRIFAFRTGCTKIILFLLISFTVCAFAATYSETTDLQSNFAICSKSVVVVIALDSAGKQISMGSGVAIKNNLIITNFHVVKNSSSVVISQLGKSFPGEIQKVDPDRDLCGVVSSEKQFSAAKIDLSNFWNKVKVGRKVFAIGAPQGLEMTLSDGIVSGIRNMGSYLGIQTTASISPGSSGGGLFTYEGNLIGITTCYLHGGQNLNFAIPVVEVAKLLARPTIFTHPVEPKTCLPEVAPIVEKKAYPGFEKFINSDGYIALEEIPSQFGMEVKILGDDELIVSFRQK